MRILKAEPTLTPQTNGAPHRRSLICTIAPALLSTTLASAVAQTGPVPQATRAEQDRMTLTLPQALALAMQHNRRLQLARLAAAEADQKKNIAHSDYMPHVRNESAALYITALEGVVIPAGAFAAGPSTGPIPTQTVRLYQGAQDAFTSETGLVQPITQLLRVHADVRAASADVAIAKLDAADAEDATALLVHQLYYDILTRQMQRSAADEAVKAGTVVEQESTQAVVEGRSLDLVQLESHAALLEQQQTSLTDQLAIDDLTMQFDDVLGLPLGTKLELDADLLGEDAVLPTEEEAVACVRESNPRVLSARQAVEKARASVSAAKDAYIPNISGLARYSYQSGVPFLVHNFGTFGGIVSYDLFDGGAREAKLRQARIELHMAELQLAQAEADVSVQVSAAYNEIRKLQQLIAVATESLAVRQEAARVSEARLRESAALASETARAHANVASAQASLVQAKLDLLLVQNRVKELLGERPN